MKTYNWNLLKFRVNFYLKDYNILQFWNYIYMFQSILLKCL